MKLYTLIEKDILTYEGDRLIVSTNNIQELKDKFKKYMSIDLKISLLDNTGGAFQEFCNLRNNMEHHPEHYGLPGYLMEVSDEQVLNEYNKLINSGYYFDELVNKNINGLQLTETDL